MSYTDHNCFRGCHPGTYKATASDQVEALRHAHIPELKAIAADRDLAITVRQAAERTIRKIQRLAKQGVVCGTPETINNHPSTLNQQ